jgi:hypothetical protein
VILLSRLMGGKGISKAFFLILLTLSYPTLVFAVTLEGYILIAFFTTLFLYILFHEEPNRWKTCFAFSAAAGALLSSGALVLFFARLKSVKEDLCNITRALFTLFALILFYDSGFFKGIGTSNDIYARYTGFTFTMYDKILQFVNFIFTCFVKPETIIDFPRLGVGSNLGIQWESYMLADIHSLNWIGLALFALCVIGFCLSFRDRFAQICAFWIAFSFVLLCLIGWGTAENSLILYSLYFSWAYFCLVFFFFDKLLQKWPRIKYTVFSAFVLIMAWINIPAMYDLVQFGIKYYPCS